ncbi:hypothetical protein [Kordia sp.]|uniref:hypothetical protein n=1 Tax=Kordia sp. TaxID=1965332 RepID=UPI003B5C9342
MGLFHNSFFTLFLSVILIFFSTISCSSPKENRIEFQTILGFPLTADQVKKIKSSYFELGYHDDILLRKSIKNNRVKNIQSEYFNLNSSKIDSIKQQIDFFSSTKTGNGSRIVSGTSGAIFTSIDTYTNYEIQEKEYYGKSIIRNEIYVLADGKAIAFQKKSRLNKNDEFNSFSYGENDDIAFYKFYYNVKGELVLFCDYLNEKYHVCEPSVLDVPHRLISFPLKDFDRLKRAYFPFEDISYFKDATLKPSSSYLASLQERSHDQAQYRSQIGTKITKESLHLVRKYDKYTYTTEGFPRKIEHYEEGKLINTTYFLAKDELEENAQQQLIGTENYTIVKAYEVKKGIFQIFRHYTKDTLMTKEIKVLDQQQRIIGHGEYEVSEKIDYSKNIKFYYDDERNITLIFYYQSNGDIDSISYQQNGMVIYTNDIGISKWWKSKLRLFPNEDMDFYRKGSL